ncbi:MAG: NfeD family protein [Myxococcaceae bacterium]
MSTEHVTWAWLIAGVLLIASEAVIPGAVVIFLGAAALLVGAARWLGLLEGWAESLSAWFILSTLLTLALRGVVSRWSEGEKSFQSTDEDADAFGTVVTVSSRITGGEFSGRIRFRGTTWPARSVHGALEPGEQVRIVDRDNVSWIVEKV